MRASGYAPHADAACRALERRTRAVMLWQTAARYTATVLRITRDVTATSIASYAYDTLMRESDARCRADAISVIAFDDAMPRADADAAAVTIDIDDTRVRAEAEAA